MNKNRNGFINVMAIAFSLLFAAGCFGNSIEASESSVASTSNGIAKNAIYTDSGAIETDTLKIEAQDPVCNKSGDNYLLNVYFKITNKESKTNEYEFRNTKLIKESTGTEYTVNGQKKYTIEGELSQTVSFSSTIPASISDDKYKLTFEINGFSVAYHLYEIPDELRADRKINYYISNTLVKTDIVKDGRRASSLFVYETSDNLSYCDTWYTKESRVYPFSKGTVVISDIDLYGEITSNLEWMTATAQDTYCFISGVKHIPSNGSLVLPHKYQDKELCISNYAMRNIDVKKIYIPKTVHTIYTGNFTGIGNATIYYEGTEAEWRSLFYMSSDVVTSGVVYNTSY